MRPCTCVGLFLDCPQTEPINLNYLDGCGMALKSGWLNYLEFSVSLELPIVPCLYIEPEFRVPVLCKHECSVSPWIHGSMGERRLPFPGLPPSGRDPAWFQLSVTSLHPPIHFLSHHKTLLSPQPVFPAWPHNALGIEEAQSISSPAHSTGPSLCHPVSQSRKMRRRKGTSTLVLPSHTRPS